MKSESDSTLDGQPSHLLDEDMRPSSILSVESVRSLEVFEGYGELEDQLEADHQSLNGLSVTELIESLHLDMQSVISLKERNNHLNQIHTELEHNLSKNTTAYKKVQAQLAQVKKHCHLRDIEIDGQADLLVSLGYLSVKSPKAAEALKQAEDELAAHVS